MSKQTAANIIPISYLRKSCNMKLLPFDSHYAIFHLCNFCLVPKCAYLEDLLFNQIVPTVLKFIQMTTNS